MTDMERNLRKMEIIKKIWKHCWNCQTLFAIPGTRFCSPGCHQKRNGNRGQRTLSLIQSYAEPKIKNCHICESSFETMFVQRVLCTLCAFTEADTSIKTSAQQAVNRILSNIFYAHR